MKTIKNISELEEILSNQDPNWKEIVCTELELDNINTGKNQNDWVLENIFDEFTLDDDGFIEEEDEIIVITSIEDFIKCVEEMESYKVRCKDVQYAFFKKSELYDYLESYIPQLSIRDDDCEIHEFWLNKINAYENSIEIEVNFADGETSIDIDDINKKTMHTVIDEFEKELDK